MRDKALCEPVHPFWPLACLTLVLVAAYLVWVLVDIRRDVRMQRLELQRLSTTLDRHIHAEVEIGPVLYEDL